MIDAKRRDRQKAWAETAWESNGTGGIERWTEENVTSQGTRTGVVTATGARKRTRGSKIIRGCAHAYSLDFLQHGFVFLALLSGLSTCDCLQQRSHGMECLLVFPNELLQLVAQVILVPLDILDHPR